MDSKGNLYGTDYNGVGEQGGSSQVFELSRSSGGWTEHVIPLPADPPQCDGSGPGYAGLSLDSAGNIFGADPCAVWEMSPNGKGGWQPPKIIYEFNGANGAQAGSAPVPGPDGTLYGTTYTGGNYNSGTIYQLSPGQNGKWTGKVLHSFKGGATDGSNPNGGVLLDEAGNIYGTTTYGGENPYDGTVFELVAPVGTGGYTKKILWNFNGTDGENPSGSLILGGGNLYGMTYGGSGELGETNQCPPYNGGCVYEVTP